MKPGNGDIIGKTLRKAAEKVEGFCVSDYLEPGIFSGTTVSNYYNAAEVT